jgi:hypothetical protein
MFFEIMICHFCVALSSFEWFFRLISTDYSSISESFDALMYCQGIGPSLYSFQRTWRDAEATCLAIERQG